MTLLGLLAALAAFGLLGLATDAHHGRWLHARPSTTRKRVMRRTAWLLIAACSALAIGAHGFVFGPIVWIGLVMLGGAFAFLMLNFVAPGRRTVKRSPRHDLQDRQ